MYYISDDNLLHNIIAMILFTIGMHNIIIVHRSSFVSSGSGLQLDYFIV